MKCECGKDVLPDSLQCAACRKAAVAKLVKIAAAIGAVLGLICSRLPEDYHKPCKTVATLLASC